MTKEEVIRIRNTGCGKEWPKVWSRQLDQLCDAYLQRDWLIAELERCTGYKENGDPWDVCDILRAFDQQFPGGRG